MSNWAIGIIRRPAVDLVGQGKLPTPDWFEPPEGRYFADPFAIEKDGRTYLFFEDYDHQTKKGHISVIESSDLQTFSQVQPALEQPFHLSYPYVIEHDGRHFMVPEQAESGEVALYEAENFPHAWVKRSTLLDGFPGIDTTIFQHEGRWWMFLGNLDHYPSSVLYAFYANDLFGPWRPHEHNPVKSEPQSCRSAGTPFHWDGVLVRPAQDSSRTYGGRLIINKVTSLSENEFEEQFVEYWEPDADWPYPDGLHTVSGVGNVTIIDVNRLSWVPSPLPRVLANKCKALVRSLLTASRAPRW